MTGHLLLDGAETEEGRKSEDEEGEEPVSCSKCGCTEYVAVAIQAKRQEIHGEVQEVWN